MPLSAGRCRQRLVNLRKMGNSFLISLSSRMNDIKCKAAIGFLTVVSDAEHGLFGGYLVLNRAGRPMEFHCTAPVKPNRAQEILYGPTLEPFLFGEQIGQTLVRKATSQVLAVCTDREPVLAVREFVDIPVAMVLPAEGEPEDSPAAPAGPASPVSNLRFDQPHGRAALVTFVLGKHRLAIPSELESDRQVIADRLGPIAHSLDLLEPFQRIRDAIAEARRGGAAG